jgi:hypothetical protein
MAAESINEQKADRINYILHPQLGAWQVGSSPHRSSVNGLAKKFDQARDRQKSVNSEMLWAMLPAVRSKRIGDVAAMTVSGSKPERQEFSRSAAKPPYSF